MMNDADIIKALECCSTTEGGNCEECPFYAYEESECLQKVINEAHELSQRQQAEIKRLNANMDVMVKEHERLINNTKSEAIKAFAERLKSKSELVAPSVWAELYRAVSVEDIDKLVKIAGGENDG